MSDEQNQNKQLKLFATAPHECSYIDGNEASTVFIDPDAEVCRDTYTYLSEHGFRRSGNFIYKPDCMQCNDCISIRIPVSNYQFSRSEKRALKKNADLSVTQVPYYCSDEHYQLYADYINVRHKDGDMYPPSEEQFKSFLNNGLHNTFFFEFRLDNKLKAVAVVDELRGAYSAIYTYYDPSEPQRSLGTLAVLWQIQQAQQHKLDYLYLGYWVKKCDKMNYKTRFRPLEVFLNRRWLPLI